MGRPKPQRSTEQRQAELVRRQRRRNQLRSDKRADGKGYSLEGLRLGPLLSQLQALLAVQGLQELRPRDKKRKSRYVFSEDPRERANQRQWLMFKADWLEALLEDTLTELEALEAYEAELKSKDDAAGSGEPRAD